MEPLPCILIRVAGPLEQTGLQDVEVTADIVEAEQGKKPKKCELMYFRPLKWKPAPSATASHSTGCYRE